MTYILIRHVGDRFEDSDVSGPLLQIGRGGTANLRLDDDAVALEHAQINEEGEGYVLIDQNSITGTYANGKRVQTLHLTDGDQITIGPFLLVIHLPGPGKPLHLDISPVVSAARPDRGVVAAQKVDYAADYALSRKFLNKTVWTLIIGFGGAAFLGSLLWGGKTEIFRPGSVSDAHALFTNQCARCHVPWRGPSEETCVECHLGPVHHKEQVFTPSCFSCHAEHQDRQTLAAVVNKQCVQCHADLKTRDGKPSIFVKNITDFARDHPEFAISVKVGSHQRRVRLNDKGARQFDLAKIKLNHELHLKPRLKGPKGPIRLMCKDCHVPAADGMLMAPITYQAHCKECHELKFDSQYPKRQVPHASPEIVHAYLIRVYAELEDEMMPYPQRARRLVGKTPPTKLSPSIIQKVWETETNLFKVTCRECHQLNLESLPLPRVEKPDIPVTWLQHARFSHKAHRMLGCVSCHTEVSKSRETTDVLLPGIQTCQNCHRKTGESTLLQKARAPIECVACHNYHDKSGDRDWDGRFTVERLF